MFKVGDKVRYKEFERSAAYSNYHDPDMIYTIRECGIELAYFQESKNGCAQHRLELVDTSNRHPHYDLIVAWASDPKNVKIQVKSPYTGVWTCVPNPSWIEEYEYRIKPKAKKVKVWNWVYSKGEGNFFVTDVKYTEEEIKKIETCHIKAVERVQASEEEIEVDSE
ncbi:MAG TPA: hypothetical protein VFM18_04015 [Methanosarcina sp.]|nr:hypothetical protein [Methanosarcina sp.]